jgi:hypothetical protein
MLLNCVEKNLNSTLRDPEVIKTRSKGLLTSYDKLKCSLTVNADQYAKFTYYSTGYGLGGVQTSGYSNFFIIRKVGVKISDGSSE